GIKVLVIWVAWQSGAAAGVGALVALLALLDRAYQPIAIANVLYVQFRLDRAAFDRLDAFLTLPEDARLTAGEPLRAVPDSVRLEHVTVRYDGRAGGFFSGTEARQDDRAGRGKRRRKVHGRQAHRGTDPSGRGPGAPERPGYGGHFASGVL
ncbi:MAG TPA: hypothetical protein PKE04_17620, partial [Clostridia bacterium]|nr:hypothetical protein [Clostridia bacterium]